MTTRRRAAAASAVLLVVALLAGCGPLRRPPPPQPDVAPVAPVAGKDPAPTPAPDPHPDRLSPGERPPQFVLVSFDGGGWHDMWQHWFSVADRVPFHFTAFLSGTYLLSGDSRDRYHPPHYAPGTSAIGWNDPGDVPVEIRDLNRALREGHEIGTHYNGHFCVGAGYTWGGNSWSGRDWDHELDQFFSLLTHVRRNNDLGPDGPRLTLRPDDVRGGRTPCLEGLPDRLYPAMSRHGLDYDSSFSHAGLVWPTRTRDGVWDVGMAVYPVHGRLPDGRRRVPVTTMDYNYFFTQRGGTDAGVTRAQSARDERQVLATYRDLYRESVAGNRAPLVLGNHFNDWNHGAYRDALTRFVLETCGRPGTRCVTYGELVDWLEQQRPAVLARLGRSPRLGQSAATTSS